jgi:hypothetical protein
LLLNKNLLKEITAEAQSLTKVTNDEDHDSEGCSSSEEDIEPPASPNRKVIEVIQEEPIPEKVNPNTSSTIGGDST